jgi:hypothetical protein
MKRALLGLSNNISINAEKIKLWAKSFNKFCNDDIILLAANATAEDMLICEQLGVKAIPVNVDDSERIFHKRLECVRNFLSSTDIELFLVTDVFDVAFQANPFDKLDTDSYDIFVSGEGVDIRQEPWNGDNIKRLFPQYISQCLNHEVVCSGVIGGKTKALIDLYDKMFDLCENSTNLHNIQDQAALIVLIYCCSFQHKIKIFNLDDGWAMHCAVAGPTEFFDKWGFRNNIKYGIPLMINNNICTSKNIPFDIIHQFNRTPEWHNIIKSNL